MVNERDANAAREQNTQLLTEMGAHAIAVDEVRRAGEKTFAVVAYVPEKPAKPMPKSLQVKRGKKTLRVPLKVQVSEKFALE
jgi:hypothetical protein